MSYTPKHWRVIAWYAKREKVTPQLSAKPMIRFKRQDGSFFEEDIGHLTDWYNQDLEQQTRERAKKRREEAKADKQREQNRKLREARTS
jgi:hypothetical protein